jgi:hypothetical protein
MAAAGRVEESIDLLVQQKRIVEMKDPATRYERIAAEYLNAHEARQNCLVVSPANEERKAINQAALGKVMTLLQRHLEAGDSHVPARALWHVLHDAGFSTAPTPNLTHAEHMALKNVSRQEQKKEQTQTQQPEAQQKQNQHRGMRI